MDKQEFFERNLLALARFIPLCSQLSKAVTTLNRYRFLDSPSGEVIPAWVDPCGSAHPLHSLVDPRREAKRILESEAYSGEDAFIVFLGLGGGFLVEAALEQKTTALVLVMDFDINGIAELLCHRDYVKIFSDPRFHFLADPPGSAIEEYILSVYKPMLCGGIRTLPLRSRISGDSKTFDEARQAIENAIQRISADYSVQAYFGCRWFSNIIRNIKMAERTVTPLRPIRHAAITAAGPSLYFQIKRIRERRDSFFLIAADTSLPCLLSENIVPDAVVAIDCQHISYFHFMAGLPAETCLLMDLAGPPPAASQSEEVRFFSGNHPLTGYICKMWRALPEVDTSGGNVTYACIALAEKLGAATAELYGADFSYPAGLTYSRGAYIQPLFESGQNRLMPLESHYSAFLYRGPLQKKTGKNGWYYESPSLKFYREGLEKKSMTMNMEIIPQEGLGAPIHLYNGKRKQTERQLLLFGPGKCRMKAEEFLETYRTGIVQLQVKSNTDFYSTLKGKERQILTTLLPVTAALKRRHPGMPLMELMELTRDYCICQLDKVLNTIEA